jgi:trans-aconitate 2-methyltransferase
MPQWDPKQYLLFAQERTQPAVDLVQRIPLADPQTIIDIGCGPGNSTQILAQRYPRAAIVGLDSSAEMIAQARADYPDREWRVQDAATFAERECYDVVFSNAVFQWILGHEELVPRLMAAVRPGGVFAFQVPANQESPLHRSLGKIAGRPEWARYWPEGGRIFVYLDLPIYYDLLAPLSAKVELWETTYYHLLASRQALVEWYRGTGLRPFLEKLPDDDARTRFEQEILEDCRAAYPLQADGRLLFPFRRLFCVATKPM